MEALGSILKDSFNQQAFSCVGDQMLEQFARGAADSPDAQNAAGQGPEYLL